jgi:hypothetical protein
MTWYEFYTELKGWQSGIAAILAFIALIIGALYNAHLTRCRDDRLRKEEWLTIAIAIYSEILLLREEAAALVKGIAANREHHDIKIDEQFLEDHKFVAEPRLYMALSSRLGLLPAELLKYIARFYNHIEKIKISLPMLLERERSLPGGRKVRTSYHLGEVVKPAVDAVFDVKPALRRIEALAGLSEAKDPDVGFADVVIADLEELQQADHEGGA